MFSSLPLLQNTNHRELLSQYQLAEIALFTHLQIESRPVRKWLHLSTILRYILNLKKVRLFYLTWQQTVNRSYEQDEQLLERWALSNTFETESCSNAGDRQKKKKKKNEKKKVQWMSGGGTNGSSWRPTRKAEWNWEKYVKLSASRADM